MESEHTGDDSHNWQPYSRQRLKAQVVPLYGFNVVVSRKPSVAVHDKRDMLRDGPLLEGADEKLSKLSDSPCNRGRGGEPLVYTGVVEGTHADLVEGLGSGIIGTLGS